jgi:hypothetical protein
MRLFCLTVCSLFASHAAVAQSDFQTGSYVLENAPSVRHVGLIGAGTKKLHIKGYEGKLTTYPWAEVRTYRLGNSRYVKASGFIIKMTLSERVADHEFVQLLDSGTVSLMRYEYASTGGFAAMPAVGGAPGLLGAGSISRPSIYLLQRAGEDSAIEIPYSVMDGSGKKFREALAPFVASRPDLVKVLAAKKITVYNLETFIHAFNTHEPFLNYPMEGVQSNP